MTQKTEHDMYFISRIPTWLLVLILIVILIFFYPSYWWFHVKIVWLMCRLCAIGQMLFTRMTRILFAQFVLFAPFTFRFLHRAKRQHIFYKWANCLFTGADIKMSFRVSEGICLSKSDSQAQISSNVWRSLPPPTGGGKHSPADGCSRGVFIIKSYKLNMEYEYTWHDHPTRDTKNCSAFEPSSEVTGWKDTSVGRWTKQWTKWRCVVPTQPRLPLKR